MHANVRTERTVQRIASWPTDLLRVSHKNSVITGISSNKSVNIIMFIPGNPGCVGWYVSLLEGIVDRLGPSWEARGISYAGHGIGPFMNDPFYKGDGNIGDKNAKNCSRNGTARDVSVALTLNGQIRHKSEWVKGVLRESLPSSEIHTMATVASSKNEGRQPMITFITHSIGAHIVQRLLCSESDILQQTSCVVHLMPFVRYDPYPRWKKWFLSALAGRSSGSWSEIRTSSTPPIRQEIFIRTLQSLVFAMQRIKEKRPETFNRLIDKLVVSERSDDVFARQLTADVMTDPILVRNHLTLGFEELRDLPGKPDMSALRIIAKQCPTSILFAADSDHWAPSFHMQDLMQLQRQGRKKVLHPSLTSGCSRYRHGHNHMKATEGVSDMNGNEQVESNSFSFPGLEDLWLENDPYLNHGFPVEGGYSILRVVEFAVRSILSMQSRKRQTDGEQMSDGDDNLEDRPVSFHDFKVNGERMITGTITEEEKVMLRSKL